MVQRNNVGVTILHYTTKVTTVQKLTAAFKYQSECLLSWHPDICASLSISKEKLVYLV